MEKKHFSHHHYLKFHQIQPGPQLQCSGCKSPVTGPAYMCWQCSFFLHQQCFQASRSLNHPSHPSHPLTLTPYPTYPSGSFICNSCNQIGHGFSFTCAHCDFDLHVHCAYHHTNGSYSYPNHSFPNENLSFNSQFPFFTPNSCTHGTYHDVANMNHSLSYATPSFNAQNSYVSQNTHYEYVVNGPNDMQNSSLPNSLLPCFNNQLGRETASSGLDLQYPPPNLSFDTQLGPQIGSNGPHLQYPPPNLSFDTHLGHQIASNGPNLQCPPPNVSFNSQTASDHQSVQNTPNLQQNCPPNETFLSLNAQTRLETAIPDSCPSAHNVNHSLSCPTTSPNAQNHYIPQTTNHEPVFHSPNPQSSLPDSSLPSFNTQLGTETASQGPNLQNPLPNFTIDAQTCPNPETHQPVMTKQDQTIPSSNSQTGKTDQPTDVSDTGDNRHKLRGLNHFSHNHPLIQSKIREEDGILCSGCDQNVSGSAYTCTVSNCNFHLHNLCFRLPREIQHGSHPKHGLTLLSSPPYEEANEFTCDACLQKGASFTYHCPACTFDLHVNCAFLSETMKREDHEHPLTLFHSFPLKNELIVMCDVCRESIDKRCWFYYCQNCDFGTHLDCVKAQVVCPKGEESGLASALETQQQLEGFKNQLKISQQIAQINVSAAQSAANLV